jgi:caspase domain-containing protein
LLICLGCLGCHPALAETRVALVVGNSAYQKVPSLTNPTSDATALAAMFKAARFDLVELKFDLAATELRRALREFASRTRDADIAVVYYAGHGIELDGNNFLVPVDAALQTDGDVLDETVSVERVLFAVEPAKRLRLVILDACRDNPFVNRMKRTVAWRGIWRGLAKVEPTSPNTLIAFAAKAGSTASDGDFQNSPFATALVEYLPRPGLDIRRALGYVRDDVLKNTGNKQEPYVYGSLGGDDVSLVPVIASKAAPQDIQSAVRRDYELALQLGTRDGSSAVPAMSSTILVRARRSGRKGPLTPISRSRDLNRPKAQKWTTRRLGRLQESYSATRRDVAPWERAADLSLAGPRATRTVALNTRCAPKATHRWVGR